MTKQKKNENDEYEEEYVEAIEEIANVHLSDEERLILKRNHRE